MAQMPRRRGDDRVYNPMGVAMPAIGRVRAMIMPVVPRPMGVMVFLMTEAEPYESFVPHHPPSLGRGPAHRCLVMALNSSSWVRCSRVTGPAAASRQWSM
jgi:hypothetical protein